MKTPFLDNEIEQLNLHGDDLSEYGLNMLQEFKAIKAKLEEVKSEQLKVEVFTLANKLALAGEGDVAIAQNLNKNKKEQNMKANELRIGNFVADKTMFGIISPIQGIIFDNSCYQHFVQWQFGDEIDINLCGGVPLTGDWLLKFGFKQKTGIMCWEKEDVEIVYESISKLYRLYPRTNPIKYVHQLQNLYFALTGEELEISDTQ